MGSVLLPFSQIGRVNLPPRLVGALAVCVLFWLGRPLHAAHTLAESADDRRVFRVHAHLEGNGTLETALQGGKALAHKLKVNATLDYNERRLSGTGRDALALRSARYYDQAEADVTVGDQKTSSRLRDDLKLLVAQGRRDGIALYSPKSAMTAAQLDLLRMSGDSLAILAMLPNRSVEPGDAWNCDGWALQMLTGTDAMLKGDLSCKLISVRDDVAAVEFTGTLEGASAGASTNITVSGRYEFDLKAGFLKLFELNEKEKRVLGTKPGYNITARVVVERRPVDKFAPLSDDVVADIPLEPGEGMWMLRYDLPWSARFVHDRNWHVFRQTDQVVILRLLDQGSFIAQCNVAKIAKANPGEHTSDERFQEDIRKALGDRLDKITNAELVKSTDGVYRYRVTAAGVANDIPVTWIYYLCAAPSGEQLACVFAVETKLLERLANRDLGIVNSLEFVPRSPAPQDANVAP